MEIGNMRFLQNYFDLEIHVLITKKKCKPIKKIAQVMT